MSVYLYVEITDKDEAAKARYAEVAGATIESVGGRFLTRGPLTTLHGESPFERGLIVEFPDRQTAIDWYNSPAYQAILETRNTAFDSRFVLIG
jgi:uncharacterized protein (DUF1330 family)